MNAARRPPRRGTLCSGTLCFGTLSLGTLSLGTLFLGTLFLGTCLGALTLGACSDDPGPKPREAFADHNGIQVFYKDYSSEDPDHARRAVVLLHGWAADHTVWQLQAPVLARKVRTILIDLPGHGASSGPANATYSMDLFAHAIDQVRKDCGVEQVVVVGHSNGAIAARQFYRRFPDKTLGLVSIDSMLRLSPASTPANVQQLVAPFRKPDYKERVKEQMRRLLEISMMSNRLKQHLEAVALATPQHVLVRSTAQAFWPEVWTELKIQVPLLVVNLDHWQQEPGVVDHIRQLGPDVDYRTVKGASHYLILDKPEEFNEILLGFLRKLGLLK